MLFVGVIKFIVLLHFYSCDQRWVPVFEKVAIHFTKNWSLASHLESKVGSVTCIIGSFQGAKQCWYKY